MKSKVLLWGRISGPLLASMEVIWLSGYDFLERVAITEQYLVPKSMQESGLVVLKELHPTTPQCHGFGRYVLMAPPQCFL
jgi:hypothetical protein